MHGLLITPADESAWLAERMNSVGASEAAAAIGVSPYDDDTPVDLWMRKTRRAAPKVANESMEIGKLLEPVVAHLYEQRTGRTIGLRQQFLRHPEIHFMTATIDGMTDDRLVEIKTTSDRSKEWGEEESDSIPENYLVQVHQQMAVTGAVLADVAVLIGGQRFKIYTVERNEDLIEHLVRSVCDFWQCVEEDTPPTWGRKTSGSLAILNPQCHGEIDIPQSYFSDIFFIEDANRQMKGLEERKKASQLRLLEVMGNSMIGRLPDGRVVKRYLETVPERTQIVKAHTKHYTRILKGNPR